MRDVLCFNLVEFLGQEVGYKNAKDRAEYGRRAKQVHCDQKGKMLD